MAVEFTDHPLRGEISAEIHARPVEAVPASGHLTRIAVLLPAQPDAATTAAAQFSQWCVANGLPPPGARQHTYEVAGYRVTWELHTEFMTLTWLPLGAADATWPSGIGLEPLTQYRRLVAARIDLLPWPEIPATMIAALHPASLSVSAIEEGRGQIASDLVPGPDGITRIAFATGEVSEARRAVVARRLLEIETYRVLALLALPLARALSPELAAAEGQLTLQMSDMGDVIDKAESGLDRLQALAVTAGKLAERISYRFAATFAYGDLLSLRLERLAERPLGYSTLRRYLDNRIAPALATCRAFETRLAALTSKLDRAIGLLNARISLDMEKQNRAALAKISETAQSQYRLQTTVEGLSTIAISYYLLGILADVLTGADSALHISSTLVVAAAAPFVLLFVWLSLRWLQRRHRW